MSSESILDVYDIVSRYLYHKDPTVIDLFGVNTWTVSEKGSKISIFDV